jgi:hypothetical protein
MTAVLLAGGHLRALDLTLHHVDFRALAEADVLLLGQRS